MDNDIDEEKISAFFINHIADNKYYTVIIKNEKTYPYPVSYSGIDLVDCIIEFVKGEILQKNFEEDKIV